MANAPTPLDDLLPEGNGFVGPAEQAAADAELEGAMYDQELEQLWGGVADDLVELGKVGGAAAAAGFTAGAIAGSLGNSGTIDPGTEATSAVLGGAAAGAVAGAVVGGPVGAAVGAVVGAIAGALGDWFTMK
jgi:hypothetical protein